MSFGNITLTPLDAIGFLTPFGPREINEIPLDVVLEEQIEHSAVVTRHPIEVPTSTGVSRGTVSDHAYLEPTIYTMRGVVSDLPISWRLFRSDTLTSYANSNRLTRSLSAYELLLKHFRDRVPFTLVTPFGELENMLFRRFSCPRNPTNKHAIEFSAEIVELQFVASERITSQVSDADVVGDQAQTRAVSEVERGEVAPIEVE